MGSPAGKGVLPADGLVESMGNEPGKADKQVDGVSRGTSDGNRTNTAAQASVPVLALASEQRWPERRERTPQPTARKCV